MNKNLFSSFLYICGIFLLLFPCCVFAASTTEFGAQDIMAMTDKLQQFMFGPLLRTAGVIGGGYGVLQAAITATWRPLVMYGGAGVGALLMPKFIEGVFGASAMLI